MVAFQFPISILADSIPAINHGMTWTKLEYIFVYPMSRCTGRTDDENFREALRSDIRLHFGMLQQRFGLRAKDKYIVHLAIEERLHPKTVPCQKHLIAQTVPDGKSKNAIQLFRTVRSPFDIGMEQNLRIAFREKMMPALLEFDFELRGII
ncbi:hypothetical protein D3C75_662280 [compost metagenome]